MVFHMLLFQPRPDLTEADRRALIASFLSAIGAIPSIRRCHVGRRVRHGAGYEALPLADVLAAVPARRGNRNATRTRVK